MCSKSQEASIVSRSWWFLRFPLTFSANHSHCKTSAIKHWPAGDKEPSHLAGGAPYVTSPSYKQPVMALLPYTSPSYLSPCKPRSGKTTCRNSDKTIRGIECNDCPTDTGHCCWSNNKLFATYVQFVFNVSHSQWNPGETSEFRLILNTYLSLSASMFARTLNLPNVVFWPVTAGQALTFQHAGLFSAFLTEYSIKMRLNWHVS